jgi:hypothetical protein
MAKPYEPNPNSPLSAKVPPDLAGAVALIQADAREATKPNILDLKVDDGLGGELTLPVVVARNEGGAPVVVGVAAFMKDGIELARAKRLEKQGHPDRREGTALHQSLGSFNDHVNRFKKAGSSTIWADPLQRRLVGVLDYHHHGPDSPAAWGKHLAVYPCPLSEAWTAWGGEKGLVLTQESFAELLDRRDRELTAGEFSAGPQAGKPAPPPADLLTLSNTLETFSHVKVKKERNPSTQRVTLTAIEEKGTSAAVPAAFLIRIRVFEDAGPQVLEVRLRVDVVDQEAKFHVRIHDAGEILKESFAEVTGIAKGATEVPVFIGTPEK